MGEVYGEGWFLEVDAAFIPLICRGIFENRLSRHVPAKLDPIKLKQFQQTLNLVNDNNMAHYEDEPQAQVTLSLLQSFLFMVANEYKGITSSAKSYRLNEITRLFSQLLTEQVKTHKSPSDYASQLNISSSYLNEALKEITGFSVSHWIQQEVIMETKRLLFDTSLNIKEIAHLLGYDDHSYFSRLFRTITGQSASEFRKLYRK